LLFCTSKPLLDRNEIVEPARVMYRLVESFRLDNRTNMTEQEISKIEKAVLMGKKETALLEFKAKLDVRTDSGKAEFIRDVLSLANSEEQAANTSHMLIGIKGAKFFEIESLGLDGATFNQIVAAYISPELVIEYQQVQIRRHIVGVLTIRPVISTIYVVRKDLNGADGKKFLLAGQSWGEKKG
jgi:hypothetical protein